MEGAIAEFSLNDGIFFHMPKFLPIRLTLFLLIIPRKAWIIETTS